MIFPVHLLIAFPVGLLIGAMILRSAVSLANTRIGPPSDIAVSSKDEDDWADYPIPGERRAPTAAIPVPTVGGGMAMTLCIVVVNVIVGAAIRIVIDDEPAPRGGRGLFGDAAFLARIVTLPVSFLVISGLLAAMLPTTFRRGCLVSGYILLICAGIAAICFVPIVLLGWR
jgi:hypothetical protein